MILRSFKTIQGQSVYNFYCMSDCLATCVDPVCGLFLYRTDDDPYLYDQNLLPNNLTYDKSDVQSDLELY